MSKMENPYENDDADDIDDIEDYDDDIENDEDDSANKTDYIDDENSTDEFDDFAEFDDLTDGEVDEASDDIQTPLKADRLNTPIHQNNHANDTAENIDEAIMPPFKNIPVLLNFSLGQLKISLAELSELNEGALLPLASNDAAVTIYANRQAVAKGEIVMIDERLAVQINEIYR